MLEEGSIYGEECSWEGQRDGHSIIHRFYTNQPSTISGISGGGGGGG